MSKNEENKEEATIKVYCDRCGKELTLTTVVHDYLLGNGTSIYCGGCYSVVRKEEADSNGGKK